MKRFKAFAILISITMAGLAMAAPTSPLLERILAAEQKLSSISPVDPKDADTLVILIISIDDLTTLGLKDKNFDTKNSLPLLKLMAHILRVENGPQIVEDNYPAYVRQYKKPNSLLKKTLQQLTQQEREIIEENFRIDK